MKSTKLGKLNKYEIEILEYFEQIRASFPQLSKETLICEVATKLNILDKKNIHYHKAFLKLYNNGYFEKDTKISV